MNPPGASDDLLVQARSVLLDALIALEAHRDSVVVIGAQAIYLHTGSAQVAVAEATKDSDLSIDLRTLGDDPLIEEAMSRAGFHHDPLADQPGSWRESWIGRPDTGSLPTKTRSSQTPGLRCRFVPRTAAS